MAGLMLTVALAVACTSGTQTALAPADRAVRLSVGGCGASSRTTGSGIVFDDGLVITAAHTVARAGQIDVTYPDGSTVVAGVVAIDTERDVAALAVPIVDVNRPLIGTAEAGDVGQVVGGLTSGTVDMTVVQYAKLSIEEVLGTERFSRLGYEIDAPTSEGDSGAGVYDPAGRLVGMVFAVSTNGGSTWATASQEIDQFVSTIDRQGAAYVCNQERSRIESQ